METQSAAGDLFALPADLFACIAEASEHSILTYVQLLSLSHKIRMGVHGTPRELSFCDPFGADEAVDLPTADALAALIGPCKGLSKLSFTDGLYFYGCGCTEAACSGWVDEAFGGHDRLTALEYLPTTFEPAIERILNHLPGLLKLRLGSECEISNPLLSAITRCCPRLAVLRSDWATPSELDVAALAPLAGSLQQFRFSHLPPSAGLDALVGGLSSLGTLHTLYCSPAALEPHVGQLTRLSMNLAGQERDLPGPWLSGLERLTLRGCTCFSDLAELLGANQPTLRHLKLDFAPDVSGLAPLLVALAAMTRLTHLEFSCPLYRGAEDIAALPAALLDRLDHLALALVQEFPHPLSITSSRLSSLRLRDMETTVEALSIDCPALVDLRLPETHDDRLMLKCPRLRVLKNVSAWFEGFPAPMPDLERVRIRFWDPVWLPGLMAGSPRLRRLDVKLTRADLLASVCACESLVDLCMDLDVARLPSPLVLPARLEYLWVSLRPKTAKNSGGGGEEDGDDAGGEDEDDGEDNEVAECDLQVEAPGLRLFDIDRTSAAAMRIRLNCPSLTTLGVGVTGSDLTSLELVDARAQLCGLVIKGRCAAASLLGLLARHGTRLHTIELSEGAVVDDWPRLTAALDGLPRLTRLVLDLDHAPSRVFLTCPQLRLLDVVSAEERKVVLACPLVELVSGCWPSQVELALPAPNLAPFGPPY
ncbi:hypothetical protein PAPYR_5442 [Paratrimastix pyriformis]|uniref:Uncharacterized protein n=1 Tax=Paratrimastix pyriformis TaxID=342808 RepID=A0ABQ8UHG4_9EUKA|nr:hypothetical protein PAPYR_5442 [Paratrimastix pyriformis]